MNEGGTPNWAERAAQLNGGHPRVSRCPGCSADVGRVGGTKLVYAFSRCDCSYAEYPHLVETPWHIGCSRWVPLEELRGQK